MISWKTVRKDVGYTDVCLEVCNGSRAVCSILHPCSLEVHIKTKLHFSHPDKWHVGGTREGFHAILTRSVCVCVYVSVCAEASGVNTALWQCTVYLRVCVCLISAPTVLQTDELLKDWRYSNSEHILVWFSLFVFSVTFFSKFATNMSNCYCLRKDLSFLSRHAHSDILNI